MTIAAQLILIQTALDGWAKENNGKAIIARDPVHLFALLAQRPGGVVATVMLRGEEALGEFEVGMVARTFVVCVSRGKAYTNEQADSLVKGAGGGRPLYDLLEEARELLRNLEFTPLNELGANAERCPDYKGIKLFEFGGDAILDAYQIEFSIVTRLGVPA